MKPKILITGGSGYFGSVLARVLIDREFSVHVLDENPFPGPSIRRETFQMTQGDVNDAGLVRTLLKDADVIFPLAAVVGSFLCDQNPSKAQAVNYEAIKLLNRLRSRDQQIIFPMTNAGYVRPRSGDVCDENSPMRPLTLYAKTKRDAESLLLDSGEVISLRMASLLGSSPNMRWDLLVHHFLQTAFTEKRLVLYEPNAKRNFLHVLDAVDGFIFCLSKWDDLKGQPYNLGFEAANLTKIEIVKKIQKFLPDLEIVSAKEGKDPEGRDFFISNERLRKAGFEAKRTLEQGIEEALDHLRKNLCEPASIK